MIDGETLLPPQLLQRATLRGREHAWPISDIPALIEAARYAHLLNLGGQLQFRFPDATCECYWVEVAPLKDLPPNLSWAERIDRAAQIAREDFSALQKRYDFLAEGRGSFSVPFEQFSASGHDPAEAMCFVWYVSTEIELAATRRDWRE